jgi:hypothetical protein
MVGGNGGFPFPPSSSPLPSRLHRQCNAMTTSPRQMEGQGEVGGKLVFVGNEPIGLGKKSR